MSFRHAQATGDVMSTLMGLYFNPYVLAFLSAALLVVYASSPQRVSSNKKAHLRLPKYDQWAAEWYWWNAWLYHATMDGAAGSLRLVPVVVHQYDILDLRFPTHDVVPWLVGLIELLVMHPLCLACLYCIRTRHPLRFPLELVTSTLHIMGMVLFVGAEVYQGQVHIPAMDPVGRIDDEGNRTISLQFNLYHITYYWFGFWFCNLVWGYVPLIRIARALRECRLALELSTKDE